MDGWQRTSGPLKMRSEDENWAASYARQALSDLRARETLIQANAEKCHRLHFLQMATEKTCKAYLTEENGHQKVRKTHAVVRKHLPRIAQHFYSSNPNRKQALNQLSEIKMLAGEVELLAPACDHGDLRQDNTEYPWDDGSGTIRTPCSYTFPNIDDGSRAIVHLIKLLREACEQYAGDHNAQP